MSSNQFLSLLLLCPLPAILSLQAASPKTSTSIARSISIMPSAHAPLLQYPSVQTIRPVPGRQTPTIPEEQEYGSGVRERTASPTNVQDFQYPPKPTKTGRLTAADFEADDIDTVAPNANLAHRDIHVPTRTR